MHSCSPSVLFAKIVVNEFFIICKDFLPPVRETDIRMNILKSRKNNCLIDFLVSVKNAVARGKCDEKTLKQQIFKNNDLKLLHLEIWWYLMKCDIIGSKDMLLIFDLEDYLHITKHLCSCLFEKIVQKSNHHSNFMKAVVSDFLSLLISHKEVCDLNSVGSVAYSNFLQLIAAYNMSNENALEMINTDFLYDALQVTSCRSPRIKLFILDLVEALLKGKSVSLEDVMQKNEQFLITNHLLDNKNFKLLNLIESYEITSFLKKIFIKSTEMHWENLFYILSCITEQYADIVTQIKVVNEFLLKEALNNCNQNLLLSLFILARYSTFPQAQTFPSYLQWFSSTFSSESARPINTRQKSVFFMNFLSSIINYDSSYYLKVHINRAPCLPIDCQLLVSDYVLLVKTRLNDLNESAELGLFDNVTSKRSADFDVETALCTFSKTNEVPKCVLEASMFCKVYYEQKFLEKLLSTFDGESSVRHQLITKLHTLGKLPNSLYLKYKQMIGL